MLWLVMQEIFTMKHHVTPTTCIVPVLPEVIHRDLFKPIKVTVYI